MSMHAAGAKSAHVIVLGNEKGGSGKSTTALHIAVALMKAGQRVATIDLDCRQQSFTHYIDNRRAWARRTGLDLRHRFRFAILVEPEQLRSVLEAAGKLRLMVASGNTPTTSPARR